MMHPTPSSNAGRPSPDEVPRPLRFGPLTPTDVVRFAGAGGDFNPLHHDAQFAAAAGFERPIAMGQLTAAVMSGWVTDWYGIEHLQRFSVTFRAPFSLGDVVTFSVSDHSADVDPVDPFRRLVELQLVAEAAGRTVAGGTALFSVPAGGSAEN